MTEASIERLVKMANQIALNMAANGTDEEVAEQIAQHLGKFWPPSMKQMASDHLTGMKDQLSPLAFRALTKLCNN